MSAKFYNSSRKLYEGVELNTVLNDDELDVEAAKAQRKALDGQIEVNLAEELRDFKKNGGKSWFAPYLKLKFGPGKITPNEYFYYQLHRIDESAARRFAGKQLQAKIHRKSVKFTSVDLADNKLIHQQICSSFNLPVPKISALYLPGGKNAEFRLIESSMDLADFLNDNDNFPVFAKPVDGMYSVGAMWLESVNDGVVSCKNGNKYSVEALSNFFASLSESGYMFQKPVLPHSESVSVVGNRLLSVRLLVLRSNQGPEIEIATCKIPAGNHDTDNFWHEGNMLGAVDLTSGKLVNIIQGTGYKTTNLMAHPDTGNRIVEFVLPQWNEIKELALNASRIFRDMKTQSWDICVSDSGPVILEMNWGGDLNLHQLAHQQGILSDNYCSHIRDCGFKGKLPA